MTSRLLAASLATSLIAACADAPAPEQQQVDVPTPAAESEPAPALHEVTIASIPSGATVLLEGAEIGTTPYVLKYKEPTSVRVRLSGHRDEEVTVDADSDPHVVVRLEPEEPTAEVETPPMPVPKAGKRSAPSKATPAPAAGGLDYPNVAAAKADYQAGKIARSAYDQAVRQLKSRRAAKIEVIRAQYQAGKIDKDEYNRRKRVIDNEYRGT